MPSMYEEMSDEMADDDAASEDIETETDADDLAPELDGEFAMLAEELGFNGKKAETLKKLIERCVDLRDEGGYADVDVDEPEEGAADDEELGL